jgi:NhaA family Na+:H+ antiporter
MVSTIKTFLQRETAAGIILFFAAVLAVIFANTPLSGLYAGLLDAKFTIQLGEAGLSKPLILWINDGLMAVFFFLVGLELKREILVGELANRRKLALPLFGAVGGMAIPAAIYVLVNRDNPSALSGWAIPAATDIAFALGVLALLGNRVPLALKVFLVSLAIIDDIGAIVIIAFFYTDNLSITALLVAIPVAIGLFILNRKRISNRSPYIWLGVILWIAVLKSGVHATLAGIVLGMFIPLESGKGETTSSPLRELEHALHPWVAYLVLPVFAFANAGISVQGLSLDSILAPVPLGIALGLFVGKQIGVFSFSWLAIKLGFAELPERVGWKGLYGVALLTGIGFTMSLFIGSLAFEETGNTEYVVDDRLGIILGSGLSAICGYLVLRFTKSPAPPTESE